MLKQFFCLIYIIFFINCYVKCDSINNNNEKNIKLLIERYPEFEGVKLQNLLMVSPSKQCKINQRTVYFKYPDFIEQNNSTLNITKLEINNKEYFVGSVFQFVKDIKSKKSHKEIKNILLNNGIIRLFNEDNLNLYWRYLGSNSNIPLNMNKYQRYNHMLMFHQITRKNMLYKNYKILKNKFPNDFNYMPVTFIEKNKDFNKIFKNYKISKDNLWLIKPGNSSLGKGIRFLRNITDVRNNEIVTKYIADPLLIDGRKFDIRFHVLVTGHNPLKIYLHTDGWTKLSTEKYDLDLNSLNNTFKHITNLYINKKNNNICQLKPEYCALSLEEIKTYLEKIYNLNFSMLLKEIKDIIIKSIISINHLEIEKEKKYNLSSNNLFDIYGYDIIIDSKFKPWLMEINLSPTLTEEGLTKGRKKMIYQTLSDIFNILGIVPYSHLNVKPLEEENKYKNKTEEAVMQTLCEFTRPLGGFERLFPKKDNINIYKKYFEEISENNKALWDKL